MATTKPLDAEIAAVCTKCKRQFWVSTATTPTPTICPDCYTSDHSLLRVANMGMAANEKTECIHGLADLANELKNLGAPIQKRFWGPSLEDQLTKKKESARRASKIAKHRAGLMDSLAQLARSISSVRAAELDGQIELLTKQRNLLRLQKEVRELEEGIREVDRADQTGDSDEKSDDAARRRTRLERRQAEATEFLQTIQRAFESGKSEAETVAHIRLALEEYGRELADLPIEIQQFLDRVEGQVHG